MGRQPSACKWWRLHSWAPPAINLEYLQLARRAGNGGQAAVSCWGCRCLSPVLPTSECRRLLFHHSYIGE